MNNKITKDDLKGLKSPAGFQVLYTLLIGFYSVPAFGASTSFDEFVKDFEKMPREDRRNILAKAICITPLNESEYMNVMCFAKDANGIPYSKENVENLEYSEIMEIVVDVCLAYSDCKVFF